jgi:hypothetical protein
VDASPKPSSATRVELRGAATSFGCESTRGPLGCYAARVLHGPFAPGSGGRRSEGPLASSFAVLQRVEYCSRPHSLLSPLPLRSLAKSAASSAWSVRRRLAVPPLPLGSAVLRVFPLPPRTPPKPPFQEAELRRPWLRTLFSRGGVRGKTSHAPGKGGDGEATTDRPHLLGRKGFLEANVCLSFAAVVTFA